MPHRPWGSPGSTPGTSASLPDLPGATSNQSWQGNRTQEFGRQNKYINSLLEGTSAHVSLASSSFRCSQAYFATRTGQAATLRALLAPALLSLGCSQLFALQPYETSRQKQPLTHKLCSAASYLFTKGRVLRGRRRLPPHITHKASQSLGCPPAPAWHLVLTVFTSIKRFMINILCSGSFFTVSPVHHSPGGRCCCLRAGGGRWQLQRAPGPAAILCP